MAWSNNYNGLAGNFASSEICGLYDWQAAVESGMNLGSIPFIPMLWGGGDYVNAFTSSVYAGVSGWVLGMNECVSFRSRIPPAARALLP